MTDTDTTNNPIQTKPCHFSHFVQQTVKGGASMSDCLENRYILDWIERVLVKAAAHLARSAIVGVS